MLKVEKIWKYILYLYFILKLKFSPIVINYPFNFILIKYIKETRKFIRYIMENISGKNTKLNREQKKGILNIIAGDFININNIIQFNINNIPLKQ